MWKKVIPNLDEYSLSVQQCIREFDPEYNFEPFDFTKICYLDKPIPAPKIKRLHDDRFRKRESPERRTLGTQTFIETSPVPKENKIQESSKLNSLDKETEEALGFFKVLGAVLLIYLAVIALLYYKGKFKL